MLHGHVGQHELDALEVATGWPNWLALLDVADGVVERALGDAERLRGDGDPGVVEGGQRGLEPGPLRADDPVGRDARVLEDDGPGRRALDAEFLLRLAEAETPGSVFSTTNAEIPRAPLSRVGHGHDRVVLRDPGVGDPHLGAVQHPAGPRPRTARVFIAGGVRARARLGQRVGEQRLAARDRRQVPALELFRARQQQRDGAELVHRRDQRGGGADPGHLLDHDHRGERVRALARRRLPGCAPPAGPPRSARPAPPAGTGCPASTSAAAGRDLRLGQLPDRLAQQLVLFGRGVQGAAHRDPS